MASAVYSESQALLERRPLSICLDLPPSSDPFPSPSSSFLPPPMPGAHEFAMKPAPTGRNGRKASIVQRDDEPRPPVQADPPPERPPQADGSPEREQEQEQDSALSPTTPTPRDASLPLPSPIPPSPSQVTPVPAAVPLPDTPPSASTSSFPNAQASSVVFHPATAVDVTPSPTPNRPAPPSPAVSRRVSAISTFSNRSRSSRSPSAAVSRANSTRKSGTPSRFSQQLATPTKSSSLASPLPSPHTFAFTTAAATAVVSIPRVLVHVRDFAFPQTDERFHGLGPDVPRPNRVARLNRQLRGSVGSTQSSEDGVEEEEEDDDGVDAAWDMLRRGWKGMGMGNGGMNGNGPSQDEMDLNFREGAGEEEEEVFYDAEGDGQEEEEDPLYPGLYKALYAFQPEGTAEMALEEDQVVRVVGRGGGVGWAVVIDESADTPDKHALVPESYLEPVKLDWEDDSEA